MRQHRLAKIIMYYIVQKRYGKIFDLFFYHTDSIFIYVYSIGFHDNKKYFFQIVCYGTYIINIPGLRTL